MKVCGMPPHNGSGDRHDKAMNGKKPHYLSHVPDHMLESKGNGSHESMSHHNLMSNMGEGNSEQET